MPDATPDQIACATEALKKIRRGEPVLGRYSAVERARQKTTFELEIPGACELTPLLVPSSIPACAWFPTGHRITSWAQISGDFKGGPAVALEFEVTGVLHEFTRDTFNAGHRLTYLLKPAGSIKFIEE